MSSEEVICKPPAAHMPMALQPKPECPLHPNIPGDVPVGKSAPLRLRGGCDCITAVCFVIFVSGVISQREFLSK